MDIAQEMLTTFKDDPDVLIKVISGDETLVTLRPKLNHTKFG